MQRRTYQTPVSLPGLARLRSADLLIPLILCLTFVLPLLLAFAGVGIRTGNGTALVINEIYLTPQSPYEKPYVELYNTTDATISVDGWHIGSGSTIVATLQGSVAAHDYLTVPVSSAWSLETDAVILQNAQGDQIDSVNWGQGTLGPIKSGTALVRNPQGFDTDTPKDWRPAPPTPGIQSPASLSVGTYRLLFDITNYVSLIAGFLLWGAFILIGLIAKRFETLTGQRAYWMALLVAPIGIVVYNAIQSYAFFTAGSMTSGQQLWAFSALAVSALAMAYVVYRFYNIARRILEV